MCIESARVQTKRLYFNSNIIKWYVFVRGKKTSPPDIMRFFSHRMCNVKTWHLWLNVDRELIWYGRRSKQEERLIRVIHFFLRKSISRTTWRVWLKTSTSDDINWCFFFFFWKNYFFWSGMAFDKNIRVFVMICLIRLEHGKFPKPCVKSTTVINHDINTAIETN